MFILYAVILGIIFGYITKGNLKYIVQRPLFWTGLVFVAFAIQLVIFSNIPFVSTLPKAIIVVLHYVSYLCLLIFIIRNYKNLGICVIGIGIFLNALVIFLNGGHMPTIPENLGNTSFGPSEELINQGVAVHNSAKMTSDTLLPFLGDIFYMPSWIPLSNVFSIGDIIIAVGICLYIAIHMHPVRKM